MPKRFTATEKWSDSWFCALGPFEKLLWVYALDNCDYASIWEPNFPLIKFMVGGEPDFEAIKSRLVAVPGREGKYIIPKFLTFQYGDKWPVESNAHSAKNATKRLKALGLFDLAVDWLEQSRIIPDNPGQTRITPDKPGQSRPPNNNNDSLRDNNIFNNNNISIGRRTKKNKIVAQHRD